jgi:thiopeptide-type bacteriocin biosynthesis protein
MPELPLPVGVSTKDRYPDDCQTVQIGDQQFPLAAFLRYCADRPDPDEAVGGPAARYAREVFLRAGLDALAVTARSSWLQVGLVPADRSPAELYRAIAQLARELLLTNTIGNFFFMHKPPGLRLRFESEPAGAARATRRIRAAVAGWQRDCLVRRTEPGIYEPENRIFGGPVSMRYVHRVFTADSLAWLDFHACAADGPAAWALSLAMARALFDGLEISGWEDIDVWERIRDQTGRALPPEAAGLAGFCDVRADIVECWRRPELLRRQLGPAGDRIAEDYREAVLPIGGQWRAGYFATPAAYLGPRSVAAFVTIFGWNRAALHMVRQALLAEALATREAASR